MSTDPEVDVVILTWNDAALAREAIDSALTSDGVDVAVIVVDNGSEHPFEHGDPRVQVLHSDTNLGVGGGRNLGASAGQRPFICFLDSDAELRSDCLRELLLPMLDDPRVGITCPVFLGQPPEIGAGRAPTPMRKLARGLGLTDRYAKMRLPGEVCWEVDFGIGACQVTRRSAFMAVEGIEAAYRFGPEDVDYCLRVRDADFSVWQVGTALCRHDARRSARAVFTRRGVDHFRALARHYLKRGLRRIRPSA